MTDFNVGSNETVLAKARANCSYTARIPSVSEFLPGVASSPVESTRKNKKEKPVTQQPPPNSEPNVALDTTDNGNRELVYSDQALLELYERFKLLQEREQRATILSIAANKRKGGSQNEAHGVDIEQLKQRIELKQKKLFMAKELQQSREKLLKQAQCNELWEWMVEEKHKRQEAGQTCPDPAYLQLQQLQHTRAALSTKILAQVQHNHQLEDQLRALDGKVIECRDETKGLSSRVATKVGECTSPLSVSVAVKFEKFENVLYTKRKKLETMAGVYLSFIQGSELDWALNATLMENVRKMAKINASLDLELDS